MDTFACAEKLRVKSGEKLYYESIDELWEISQDIVLPNFYLITLSNSSEHSLLQIAKETPIEILEQSSYPPHEIAELIRVTRGLSGKTP